MKNPLFYLMLVLFSLFIASCDKVIDVKIKNDTDKLVIEGNITDTLDTQTIKLSTNVAFSSANAYPPVTDATVSVSDKGGDTYSFRETSPGVYTIPKMKGISKHTYTLTVLTAGKTYTAVSVMPDSASWISIKDYKDNLSTDKDKKKITVYYRDARGLGNQYNFLLWVNGAQVKRVFANNDDLTDGNTVTFDLMQDDVSIHAGDKARVQMQCVDKAMYTYWFTLMQQGYNGPGGGVSPTNPPNNISPEALGYFSAHTIQTRTIIVK